MISEPLLDSKQRCPDRDTLVDFMLGKLPVSELESCGNALVGMWAMCRHDSVA